MAESQKPSLAPYLLRAYYDWIIDCDMTPHILVNAELPYVNVPQGSVAENGRIVLNIAPRALGSFRFDDESISFNARFGGKPMDVYVPLYAIEAIYSRETNEGTALGGMPIPSDKDESEKEDSSTGGHPTLSLVE